jgi:hypothetical protein
MRIYERLARLCFEHLPAQHIIKMVGADKLPTLRDSLRQDTMKLTCELPSELRAFILETMEYPTLQIEILKTK